jgi:hypothetical protein
MPFIRLFKWVVFDDNNQNIPDRLQARADADEPMEHQE